MDLADLRKRIDHVDQQLVALLNERATLAINIGVAKRQTADARMDTDSGNAGADAAPASGSATNTAAEVYVPRREREIYERVTQLNHGPLTNEAIIAIYREIMSASISLQKDVTIAFLGPVGTHTHQAALTRFGDSVLYIPQDTIADIFTAVETGRASYGVVPFENSTFGSVSQTLDRFISSTAHVRGETYLQVHHNLMANSSVHAIKRVYSHPEAFGHPHVECVHVSSTAHAAMLAAKELHSAAICNTVCADLYGLDVVQQNIEDKSDNTTRFFILAPTMDATPIVNSHTLVMFTVDHRQAGALCDSLKIFKDFEINLTKVDSRPSRQRQWHYVFFVEMEGHVGDAKLTQAVAVLQKQCLDLKVLGSYPLVYNG
ncbi:prephenate dehydratase [Sorochytrium milnesiophthora]